MINDYRDLQVWQHAMTLCEKVDAHLRKFPVEERYGLCDQIRRAVVSIPSNIAEGSGRNSYKEKIHFIEIAYGSLMEAFSQLQIAQDLGYLTAKDIDDIRPSFIEVAKMLSGLRKSFETKLNE